MLGGNNNALLVLEEFGDGQVLVPSENDLKACSCPAKHLLLVKRFPRDKSFTSVQVLLSWTD